MRIFCSLLAVCIVWVSACFGQTKNKLTGNDQSLLWKISGRNMTKPSYLFGTIHILCYEDYVWTPAMKKSLAQCKEVCFEMDMDDPSVMMKVAVGMVDQSGKLLKDYFTPEDYALLEQFVRDSLDMDMNMLQQIKPATLQSLFATQAVPCDSAISYEANIMEDAKRLGLEISGLEEPEEQIALLELMQTDSAVLEIVSTLKDFGKERGELAKLIAAYKQQDLPELHKLMQETETSVDMEAFLDSRNRKWIDRMEDKMDIQPVFFAVGAGHLWGTNGVIQLLRTAGYTVTPVK